MKIKGYFILFCIWSTQSLDFITITKQPHHHRCSRAKKKNSESTHIRDKKRKKELYSNCAPNWETSLRSVKKNTPQHKKAHEYSHLHHVKHVTCIGGIWGGWVRICFSVHACVCVFYVQHERVSFHPVKRKLTVPIVPLKDFF